ncbi:MAG: hypothetical protein Kow0090_20360 [Myxococcota bacterium]
MERIKELWGRFDIEAAILLLSSTLLIVIYLYKGSDDYFARLAGVSLGGDPYFDYYRYLYQHLAALLLFGVIPAIAFGRGLKRKLSENGFSLGDVSFGLKFLGIGMIILPPLLYLSSGSEEIMAEYPLTKLAGKSLAWFVLWEFTYLVYYVGYESFFRGSFFFPLADKYGVWFAILITTMASVFQHIGKPETEVLAALFAGVVFGAVAWRARSFLYILVLHWYIGALTDAFSLMRLAGK